MATTTPPSITPLPLAPDPGDRSTFNTRAYPWSAALPTFSSELSAVASNVKANADDAALSASAAANQAINAANSAAAAAGSVTAIGATVWVSGATYAIGDARYSPINFATYRRKTAGAGTTDPSLDPTNWASVVPLTPEIPTPTNLSPVAGATGVMDNATLTGSTYYSLYGVAMAAAQWQVSTDSAFATTVINTGDVAGTAVAYSMTAGVLSTSTTYYWRVRYKDANGVYSAWSTATSFTTASSFFSYIATPAATPAAFGDAFEGGFYAGMIWNELIQSSTSTTIGTGSKTFTVSNGSNLVYVGQALEVRSRANPVNKMIGTITSGTANSLTLNITSVGGSGTFSDWSIMAKYRVIVAPKATGENSAIAYKNANTAAPAACGTLTEGFKATMAMVAADTSTVYPAAHWCKNLTIAGRTDWYLPARDELELCWRNLKPTADANYTTADRPTTATPDYKNLGSYGDTANTHGLNNNSSPTGAAYTSGSPAQVAAGKNFRTSESEAFAYGSFYYWSSSEFSVTNAWNQNWGSSYPGGQGNGSKPNASYVRAVRRSII